MSNTNNLSPLAAKLHTALQRLANECEPHSCGGFTTDDMQWMMGVAFTPEQDLFAALEELSNADLIRHAGDDEEDAIGVCYEILHNRGPNRGGGEAPDTVTLELDREVGGLLDSPARTARLGPGVPLERRFAACVNGWMRDMSFALPGGSGVLRALAMAEKGGRA